METKKKGFMKLIIALLLLSSCASKPVMMKDCKEVQGGYFSCKKP